MTKCDPNNNLLSGCSVFRFNQNVKRVQASPPKGADAKGVYYDYYYTNTNGSKHYQLL